MPAYNKITPAAAEELRACVSPGRFFFGGETDPNYAHDEMPIYGRFMPEAAVDVETTEEVSAIMKICSRYKIPVTCRGAGTGLVGGCVPLYGGLVLCTRRMNRILGYDMENLVVRLQPGVLLKDLAADAMSRFRKEGVLNPATGADYRRCILDRGSSVPAMQQIRDFLGREPQPEALIERYSKP